MPTTVIFGMDAKPFRHVWKHWKHMLVQLATLPCASPEHRALKVRLQDVRMRTDSTQIGLGCTFGSPRAHGIGAATRASPGAERVDGDNDNVDSASGRDKMHYLLRYFGMMLEIGYEIVICIF